MGWPVVGRGLTAVVIGSFGETGGLSNDLMVLAVSGIVRILVCDGAVVWSMCCTDC